MSCFIVSKDVYNIVATTLAADEYTSLFDSHNTTASGFVHILTEYNVKAFKQRYEGRYIEDTEELINYIPQKTETCSKVQLLKYLNCIHYQNIDSSQYEEAKEAQIIGDLISSLDEGHTLSNSPEYQEAHWG